MKRQRFGSAINHLLRLSCRVKSPASRTPRLKRRRHAILFLWSTEGFSGPGMEWFVAGTIDDIVLQLFGIFEEKVDA
jgi:hypothetical protein